MSAKVQVSQDGDAFYGFDGNDPMYTHLRSVFPKRKVTESYSET